MGGGSLRYIIPSIIGVLLIVIILGNKFLPKQLLGSVYSIGELEEKYDKVKVGDTIDYEINGYNNWQVIGKDDYNGTIDVVSKTNTEDLVLEPNQEKSYYENKFQETAEKYIDSKYAISARSVNQGDLDYFAYDTDFWLNNVNENTITTSMGSWTYKFKNYKMYVIPYIVIPEENTSNYNKGDKYTYSDNGVYNWVVVENSGDSLVLIPETPIELVIEDVNTNIGDKADEIIDSFNQDGVWDYRNYDSRYDMNNLPTLIGTFLNQQTERILLYTRGCYSHHEDNITGDWCGGQYYYENGNISDYHGIIYTELGPKTKGFRPVVTLKVSREKEGKELTSKLKVGDNVKYSAKDYNNWKVLSIDEDAGTVDIISGGIVKNLTLTGKEDYDNLEDILQKEVDAYKNGDNVVSARPVNFDDIGLLNLIKDKVPLKYWTNNKKNYTLDYKMDFAGNLKVMSIICDASIMQYVEVSASVLANYLSLYRINLDNSFYTEVYKDQFGNQSYTAGLRPIITLKIDFVEKLSESETKKVEESTKKLDKVILKEQTTKNKDYNGNKDNTVVSSSDTNSNSNIYENDDNINDVNYGTKNYIDTNGIYRHICILYILVGLCLVGHIINIVRRLKK